MGFYPILDIRQIRRTPDKQQELEKSRKLWPCEKSHHSSLQFSLIGSAIIANPSLISWSILPSPALHTHANTRWQFLDKLLYLLVKSCLVTKNTFYSCSNSHFWPLTDSSLVNMQIYGLETNLHQLYLQLSVGQRLPGVIIICDINMSILICF